MRLGNQTITVWRTTSGGEDEYHNPLPGDPVSHVVTGCSVQPGTGAEYVIDRSATTTVYTAWAPIDADVLDDDVIEFAGARYEVDSSVQRWQVGSLLDHLVIPLKKSEG